MFQKWSPHGLKPVAPPHASSGLPSPKRLRAGRRNPPKHTLLRSFGASKGTLLAFIHGLKTRACAPKCASARRRGFLRRRVKYYFNELIQIPRSLRPRTAWITSKPSRNLSSAERKDWSQFTKGEEKESRILLRFLKNSEISD